MPNQCATEPINDNRVCKQRKAHRKVKSGCKACKARHQKCDEQRPKCAGCIRHSTECIYITSNEASQRTLPVIKSPVRSASQLFQLPTPCNNPPITPSREMNFEDLELLHQYITSTCIAIAQLPERTVQMQTTVPAMAQTHHFLMHGILAKAAVHLSWLRPAKKAHYTMLATKHHNSALPEFRSALQNINEENCRALILYSKGLVWCSFAWLETLCDKQYTTSFGTHSSWLPYWFHLLRGSCLLVNFCALCARTGFHILPRVDDTTEFSNSFDSCRLSVLMAEMLPLIESPIGEGVLTNLKESFARASMRHHNTPIRNAIDFWVGNLPNEFMDALQMAEPWALVVMAHFCVIIFRGETTWFMRGHAAELLRLIVERMPDPWEQYIRWPRDEIGV